MISKPARLVFGLFFAICTAPTAALAQLSSVDIVDPAGVLVPDGATHDPATDLDWLDVTLTDGVSFEDIQASAGPGSGWISDGWRYATTAEICTFFATYAGAPIPCPDPDQGFFSDPDDAAALVNLLGANSSLPGFTIGMYDDTTTGVGPFVGLGVLGSDGLVRIEDDTHFFDCDCGGFGSYLVREAPGDPQVGLVSYWPFDDGTADDLAGDNDGVIFGGVTPTGGGNDAAPTPNNLDALRFDGVVSEVNVPNNASLDFATTDDTTLAMWFKRESNRFVYHLLGKRILCNPMNYQLARDSQLLSLNSSSGGILSAGVDAALNTWTHIAATYNGTTQTARIYINGVLEESRTPYVLGPIVAGDLKFGHTGGCPNTQRFQGVIDEVRIYDRVLTGPEIATLALKPTQDILVAPLAHDFGQVDAFTSKDTIVTISNTGVAGLEVTGVTITSGASNFAVTDFDPPNFPPFVVPAGGDVFVTVTIFPTSEGAFAGTLTIESDDPDEPMIDVNLIGNGLVGAVEDQATELEAAVNDAIAFDTLVGSGSGNSSSKRLNAFANMIEAAGDLIEARFIAEACDQLGEALRRVDGDPRPPDFAEGDDAPLIADQIEFLRDSLGCS